MELRLPAGYYCFSLFDLVYCCTGEKKKKQKKKLSLMFIIKVFLTFSYSVKYDAPLPHTRTLLWDLLGSGTTPVSV